MKVKIICGTYGHRPVKEEPRIVRKDSTSPPFDLDDKEAQRLIELGVAEACDESIPPEGLEDNSDKGNVSKEQIMTMEYLDMKKLAKEWGISAKGNKGELREKLIQHIENDGSEDDDAVGQNVNEDTSKNADDDGSQESQNAGGNADQGNTDDPGNDEPPMLQPQEPV